MPSSTIKKRGTDALTVPLRGFFTAAFVAVLAGCQSAPPVETSSPGYLADKTSIQKRSVIDESPTWLVQAPSIRNALNNPPPEQDDLWVRIRQGFQLQGKVPNNPRIEQQRLFFASSPANITQSVDRGSPYLHYIVEQLEENNMPLELALLPIIESSYNPFAYSPSKAAGLWQFIPSTGRNFNLRQTHWYDGRRDIKASTQAAINYLSRLHDMFNGDWLLAIAAYNAGEGTVSRAIERNTKLGLPTDYWNLPLPQETRNYVPKLLAVSEIVMEPELYGMNLSPIANEPYFESVPVRQHIALAKVAELADIDEKELYQLNPAYTHKVMQDGPRQVLVPIGKGEALTASLANVPSLPRVEIKRVTSTTTQQYRVRPGDTLSGIAQRYGVSVSSLRSNNRLRNNNLRIGQTLAIRGSASSTTSTRKTVAQQYRVRNGDNLWDIARKHGVSVKNLQRLNPNASRNLRPGQMLTLRQP